MICPKEDGSLLTFSDGDTEFVSSDIIEKLYIEPGGYYTEGRYLSRKEYESTH